MKKRISIMTMLLLFCMTLPTLQVHAAAVSCEENSEGKIEIASAQQLDDCIRGNLSADFLLVSDIDLSSYSNWDPIGDEVSPNRFSGQLDGNGHVISNLKINLPNENYVGFFRSISNGSVHNVHFRNASITGFDFVGILAGNMLNSEPTHELTHVSAEGAVFGDRHVGGLIGSASVNGRYLYTKGSVKGRTAVGGLIGTQGKQIDQSFSNSNVSVIPAKEGTTPGDRGDNRNAIGGLVGSQNSYAKVQNSFATGSVYGSTHVGGLVGMVRGTVDNSYAVGRVQYDDYLDRAGGLIGTTSNGVATPQTYFDYETTITIGEASSSDRYGKAKTTAEMKNIDTFENWDFETIWGMHENNYPHLRFYDSTSTVDNREIEGIRIQLTGSLTMQVGSKEEVSVIASYSDGEEVSIQEDFLLQSSDPDVILLEGGKGIVAVGEGKATIIATYKGIETTIEITVEAKEPEVVIEEIEFEENYFNNLKIGDTGTLLVEGLTNTDETESITNGVTYISSDPDVITINNGNEYQILGYGQATITAMYEGLFATIEIELIEESEPEPEPEVIIEEIQFEENYFNDLKIGDTSSFLVKGLTNTGETESISTGVTYTSSDTEVLAITDGNEFEIKGYGIVTITAKYEELQAEIVIHIAEKYQENILPDSTVELLDGKVVIQIPQQAISSPISILVSRVDSGTLDQTFTENQLLVGPVYELTKDSGRSFNAPIQLSLTFDSNEINKKMRNVSLFWLNEEINEWVELDNVSVDWDNGTISGFVDHFTKFAILSIPIDQVTEEDTDLDEKEDEEQIKDTDSDEKEDEEQIKDTDSDEKEDEEQMLDVDRVENITNTDEQDSKQLPNTSTNTFNLLILGVLLITVAFITLTVVKRKNQY